MTVVFKYIQYEIYFFFRLSSGCAEPFCSANFALEGRGVDGRVMARVRFDDDICIGGFPVNLRSEGTIFMAIDEDIKKRYLVVLLFLAREFDPRVDFVEALLECFSRVRLVGVAA